MMFFDKVSSLRGRETRQRAFILGNGPSIRKENLSLLANEVTIGMNASTLLEGEFDFTQKYYVISDRRFLMHPVKRQWGTERLSRATQRIVRRDLRDIDDPSLQAKTKYIRPLKRDGYSFDLSSGYYFGCTTTMLALQLASFLGCHEIYMLGVDLRYSPEQPRFYREGEPQMEDSFTSVQIWNIANAYRVLKGRDIRLMNCSENSLLRPYVPYMDYNTLF
ncbi:MULTISPECIES: hypothetical protein [Cupriavidus]